MGKAVMMESDRSVTLVGSVRAGKESTISAEVEGRVKTFDRNEGDRIKKGTAVVILDDAEYKLRVLEAKGQLQKAEAANERAALNLARIERLHGEGVVSNETLENSHLEKKSAAAEENLRKAELGRAERNLSLCRVTAPFTGYLAAKKVDVGERVAAGDPLFEMVDLDHIEVTAEVADTMAPRLAQDQPVKITVDGFPGQSFPGALVGLSPKADATTRSFLVKVALDNPKGAIKAGMVARAELALSKAEPVLMIPKDAVVWSGPQAVVFIPNDKGAVRSVKVTLGLQKGVLVEAQGEIIEGSTVVVTGNEILRDGDTVTFAEQMKVAPASAGQP